MKHEIRIPIGRYEVAAQYAPEHLEDGSNVVSSDVLGRLELKAAIEVLTNAVAVEGQELKAARRIMGLRQPELGHLLDVTPETVSRWENGALVVQRQTRLAVLQLLERTLAFGEPTQPGVRNANQGTKAFSRIVA